MEIRDLWRKEKLRAQHWSRNKAVDTKKILNRHLSCPSARLKLLSNYMSYRHHTHTYMYSVSDTLRLQNFVEFLG